MRPSLSALLAATLSFAAWGVLRAEEPLPAPPLAHFNDYAGTVSAADAQRLDARLADFERQTSTQIVVAVFPTLPSPSLEDFTARTAESWKVGQKKYDNGAIWFVFVNDRKMRIEVGYGLEGALPDALAGRILDQRVKPRFAQGDWAGGFEAGIDAVMAATRGEYQAAAPRSKARPALAVVILVVLVLLFLGLVVLGGAASTERTYSHRGWRGGGPWGGGWSGGGGGGGWGGGFGGGGFSGGGGSFGGGGASSSW